MVLYPMLIGASGLIASIIGAMTITSRKISDPMNPLNIAFIVSADSHWAQLSFHNLLSRLQHIVIFTVCNHSGGSNTCASDTENY